MTSTDQDIPALCVHSISKTFGHVTALVDVSFELRRHEVLAVVGDNGAGKSTLMKILSGAYAPDPGGRIEVAGRAITFRGPADAAKAGIAMVYQDLNLVDTRDVAANLFLGAEPRRGPFVRRRLMIQEAQRSLQDFTFRLPSVKVPVSLLSGGQRQSVAVARVLLHEPQVIIMDEPTAALGVQESERVLALIRQLRERGTSVVLVSHNLQHVWTTADRIMALRLGTIAGIRERRTASVDEIVKLITYGRSEGDQAASLASGSSPNPAVDDS